jgi:hypothetical protein
MRKKFLIKPDLQFRHLVWSIGTVLFCFLLAYSLFESQISNTLGYGPLDQSRWMELRTTFRLGFLLALTVLVICIGIENYLFFPISFSTPSSDPCMSLNADLGKCWPAISRPRCASGTQTS